MILYDGTSSINWFHNGPMTREQMDGDGKYPQDGRAVLFDDGAGKVYSWKLLDAMCDEYGIYKTEDAQADFDAVVAAMNEPEPTVEQKVDEIESEMTALTSAFEVTD